MDQHTEKYTSTHTSGETPFAASLGHSYSPGHGYGVPGTAKEHRAFSRTVFAAICVICLVLAAALGSVLTLLIMRQRADTETESVAQSTVSADAVEGSDSTNDQSIFGVTLTTVTAGAAQYYNMVEGAYVYSVDAGSRAGLAGLQIGDIITAVDGTEILDADSLVQLLQQYDEQAPVSLTVFRNRESISVTLPAV